VRWHIAVETVPEEMAHSWKVVWRERNGHERWWPKIVGVAIDRIAQNRSEVPQEHPAQYG